MYEYAQVKKNHTLNKHRFTIITNDRKNTKALHIKKKMMFKNLNILSTYVENLENFQKLFMKNMICKNINASKNYLLIKNTYKIQTKNVY